MENVNGVGVIRQDTERNYKNLRAELDKVNRLKNIPPPTTATPTNRGRIGSKLIGNGISLDAPKSQQKNVDKIKQGLDKDGKLTEQVVNAWAKEMGWRVIPGGKYGSNNGFDHVFVTPTGQVALGDSKQIETFAKKPFPPDNRNPKTGFRLFPPQSLLILPQYPLNPPRTPHNRVSGPPFRRQQAHLACWPLSTGLNTSPSDGFAHSL